uniref:HMA domain-containing protein n=1 Tax=Oryza punctata TaxID=4537 RepID=A0A0E0LN41_ORYPU
MADKISTVVLNVDLECDRCYKKIRRVLCRIQDKANIKTISYDEKNNVVMVSGPFDADKVCKKLCCKAGRVIKDMQIKGGKDVGDKAKPAEKEAAGGGGGGKADKKDAGGGKAEKKDGGKPEKEAKADKAAAAKADKAEKVAKDAKPEKKVKFDLDDAPPPAAATAKPGKVPFPAGMTQADLAPLLEKLKIAKQQQQAGPEPPRPAPYDHQGWYYGNRHPYYQQQQCYEDPNAGCSVM